MRTKARLRESELRTFTKPGRYGDGDNLYLVVDKAGGRRWAFLYSFAGRRHEVGLGGLHRVSLAEARAKAAAARAALDKGLDPFPDRRSRVPTFGDLAHQHINEVVSISSQPKHVAHWQKTLFDYARPICALSVNKITTEAVVAVLKRHWDVHPATAKRIRAHIEVVLDVARARGYCIGDNPASWNRHLEHLLPAQPPQRPRGAVPWREIPRLVRHLQSSPRVASSCLIFAILTGALTSEIVPALRTEFDLKRMLWTVPLRRASSDPGVDGTPAIKRLIPLSAAVVQLLTALWSTGGSFAFECRDLCEPISSFALLELLREFDEAATVQGLRTSIDTWAIEATQFTSEIRSLALGKTPGRKSLRARPVDFAIGKRREFFDAWAAHCCGMLAGRKKGA